MPNRAPLLGGHITTPLSRDDYVHMVVLSHCQIYKCRVKGMQEGVAVEYTQRLNHKKQRKLMEEWLE